MGIRKFKYFASDNFLRTVIFIEISFGEEIYAIQVTSNHLGGVLRAK